ncbi:LRP2 [Mytilus edulis]|uniref:LRP2 n=1 Tax=Mytilus edulis TaxID=6550 RepID=A0A8S3U817_MYTED|nr:LRP2 [Mytilus edulis]
MLVTHGNGSETSDKISKGIDIFQGALSGLEKIVKPEKLLGFITKLSGFIGIAENYILEISEVNCTTQRDYRKQKLLIAESYQNHFNIKHRLYKILKGTTESISVFNDPILDLIKRTHKCNIGEVIKFANGVILLAFKGQQVVIAHEKLTGSNASIIFAVKEWSDLVYSIRNKVEDIKIECYTNINKYIKDDVQDTIYQTNMPSNKQAADSLKNKLDIKYPWLYWTVLSYGSYGSQNHWGFSTFWNMPESKDDRKRVLRVIAHDRGTYINLQKTCAILSVFMFGLHLNQVNSLKGSHVHSIAVVKVFPFKNHIRHHVTVDVTLIFKGNNCQHYSGVNLADNVNAMLAASARIPKLTTIYYELLDMQDSIGVSLNSMHHSLQAKLQEKYDNLNRKLTNEFQWTNLIVQYAHDIQQLTYYISRFKLLNSSSPSFVYESTVLATTILQSGNVPKWTFELNLLIVGRTDILIKHKPLLEIISSRHIDIACSLDYKNALDNVWRQLFILQSQAFIIWAQAKEILKQSSNAVTSRYVLTVGNQQTFFRNNTCELFVENSLNLNCSGGFYLFPKTKLLNTCKKNHYKVGDSSISCYSGSSYCLECKCNPAGSTSTECKDIYGQCFCKDHYFGEQCLDRHCKWTPFGEMGSCSKSCDYGGIKTRFRKQAISQKGIGKFCTGNAIEYNSCFNKCCASSYNCLKNKKCIPKERVCDYDNDCGNWQDENKCKKVVQLNTHLGITLGGEMLHILIDTTSTVMVTVF